MGQGIKLLQSGLIPFSKEQIDISCVNKANLRDPENG